MMVRMLRQWRSKLRDRLVAEAPPTLNIDSAAFSASGPSTACALAIDEGGWRRARLRSARPDASTP